MTNTTKVTRSEAKFVLKAIERRFVGLVDDSDQPVLVENYMDTGNFGIVWEGGPYEWAFRVASGGVNDEVFCTLVDEFGVDPAVAKRKSTESPLPVPDSIRLEPYFSFSVVICAE